MDLLRTAAASIFRTAVHGATLALALALAATAPGVQAALLYGTTAIGASPRTSDYGADTGFGWRAYDNFTVAGGGTVLRVTWSGLWFGDTLPAPAPDPDVLNWDIAFHASSGGAPGAQLSLQNYAAAQVGSTFLGNGVLTAGNQYNVSYYEYTIELTTPFVVQAGTEYWLSVMAHSDAFNPAFAWRAGVGGDDASYQEQLGPGMTVTDTFDRARDRHVRLEGDLAANAVPEPGSLLLALAALGAAGAAGVAARVRPRR